MKRLALFFSLLFLVFTFTNNVYAKEVEIDEDNFPDDAFRDYVSKNFDKNKDDVLDDDEAKAVTVIPVGFTYKITSDDYGKITVTQSNASFPDEISDFTGIEYFVNLETFSCQSNDIEELDLSKNSELKVLFCGNNQLEELELEKNTKLEFLDCSYNQIEDLDIDENLKLKALFCNNNKITGDLYADEHRDLLYFDCSYNQIKDFELYEPDKIKSVDIVFSGDKWISVDVEVKVSNDANFLTYLKCDHNNIEAINLIDLEEHLLWLKCDHNNLDSKMFAYDSENLIWLECDHNQITMLELDNRKLRYLKCDNNRITELDAGSCTPLEQLICDNNKLKDISLPRKSDKFVYLSCSSNEFEDIDNVPSCLEYINFSNNKVDNAYFLKKGTSLKTILCSSNKLDEIDLSNMNALEVFSCDNNCLAEISFAGNPSIKTFSGLNQTIYGQSVMNSNDDDYPYEFDLSDVLSRKAKPSRVINMYAFRADNSIIKSKREDSETLILAEEPAYIKYSYKPEQQLGKNYLEVTLFFDEEDADFGNDYGNNTGNDNTENNYENENNNENNRNNPTYSKSSSSGCNSGFVSGIIALSLIGVLKKKR